ncbi:LOW QUALITY PROTEIN: Hypothetical protein PHPALM_18111 [Phytophthora palmivora]|uniref:Uncharacterized protein n=1 Tax=Phytophthora palmivora TaxID=4796 RepID=A0A2P4XKL8_9STRA|nr:LOW QUALITY PROTEIN: Hypothetical protein PHPALM_18111 [Phytophthora palmivora]
MADFDNCTTKGYTGSYQTTKYDIGRETIIDVGNSILEQRKSQAKHHARRKIGMQWVPFSLLWDELMWVFADFYYLTGASFFLEAKDSYFAFNEKDLIMTGGCTGCPFHVDERIFSTTRLFTANQCLKICTQRQPGIIAFPKWKSTCIRDVKEWGFPNMVATTSAEELLQVIAVLNLSVTPQMVAELKKGIELKDKCVTQRAIIVLIHLFMFQTVKSSADYSLIPAADVNVFPEFTECRPNVSNSNIIASKLVLSTMTKISSQWCQTY